jgi:anti-anti-sigma factor
LAKLKYEDTLHIDLSGVTQIDSSGLAILVEVYHPARKIGHDVRLINVSHDVGKKIRLAHLEGVFALRDGSGDEIIH